MKNKEFWYSGWSRLWEDRWGGCDESFINITINAFRPEDQIIIRKSKDKIEHRKNLAARALNDEAAKSLKSNE